MEIKRLSIMVRGRVQGVGFRFSTREMARKNGLTGWVRNMSDGSVAIEAQGAQDLLDRFVKLVNDGPPLSAVRDLQVTEIPIISNENGFVILH